MMPSEHVYPHRGWNLRGFLVCHLAVAVLLITFFCPTTRIYWDKIDLIFFNGINGSLRNHRSWQVFLALSSNPLIDWMGDGVMVALFIFYIRSAQKELRARRIAEFIFCALFVASIAFFINRVLFRENLEIFRSSPSLIVGECIRLSREVPWIKIKDSSSTSFPGDHATTALTFAFSFTHCAGWRFGIFAWIYTLYAVFPRLIAGAHWLTDVLAGSIPIALLCLAWIFYTPIKNQVIGFLQLGVIFIVRRLKSKQSAV